MSSHRIAIAKSDVGFECAEGESVLDAAARAGIELPYSCRKGVCGNCAGVVTQGEVGSAGQGPIANETCLPDQVLFCMCAPRTDLEIAPLSWRRIDPSARKRFTAKVFRNQLAADDVSVLQLRLPAGQRAKFSAGQYLQVALPDGSTRCYSMANPPHESDSVTLHVRHVQGGAFSSRVAQLAPGDLLEIELPFGAFSLKEAEARPVVFVAGGTGFAPVKSILDDMLKRRIDRPVTLIWGARQADGIYLRAAVARWQKQWPQMRFIAAIADPGDRGAASGEDFAGRPDQALLAAFENLRGHELYCCGSPAMVHAVREAAMQHRGLDAADFHSDVFVEGPAAHAVQ
ncbi:FAD-binding oxidoreductase [Variovorax paradoxus]|uniref:Terephthalate 1,2-dioxygenase, reductase component 2 n=1 Tax=Variovorax paradoxus TaxID=34073 RepID=A0A679J6U1_VARPD|nr:Terephthalate 1,2-dioxygenase, reductase component 2 [Variovorax paradoxus]